jgi:hypothetical protein
MTFSDLQHWQSRGQANARSVQFILFADLALNGSCLRASTQLATGGRLRVNDYESSIQPRDQMPSGRGAMSAHDHFTTSTT